MRNDPRADSQMGNNPSTRLPKFRHYEEMTEQDWDGVWSDCSPITEEEFDSDYALAIRELCQMENVELNSTHNAIISNFRSSHNFLYAENEQEDMASYDELDAEKSFNDDTNGHNDDVELPYRSRCMGEHARDLRRQNEFRVRSRKIRAGIGHVVSENGSISAGFIHERTKRTKQAIEESTQSVKDCVKPIRKAEAALNKAVKSAKKNFKLRSKMVYSAYKKLDSARESLNQAKRNLFKLERGSRRDIRRGKRFLRLARHYSIYCAGYNCYLKDNWSKNPTDALDTVSEGNTDNISEKSQKTKLYDTSVPFVLEYDQPSKKPAFMDCHSTVAHAKRRTAGSGKSTRIQLIESRDNIPPFMLR